MKKILTRTVKIIVLIPVILIALFIALEALGAFVNWAATSKQTKQLQSNIMKSLQNVTVLDTYSETGNTSGTGNHVDMLSVVVFQTDDNVEQISEKLQVNYVFNEWNCWVEELKDVIAAYQEGHYYSFCENLDLPENTDRCYVFYLNLDAPFSDNIAGH